MNITDSFCYNNETKLALCLDNSTIDCTAYSSHSQSTSAPLKLGLTIFMVIASLIGNSLVILLIWLNPSFHSSINCLLMNLAVADVLITCMCMWTHTHTYLHGSYPYGALFCQSASVVQGNSFLSFFLVSHKSSCVLPNTSKS